MMGRLKSEQGHFSTTSTLKLRCLPITSFGGSTRLSIRPGFEAKLCLIIRRWGARRSDPELMVRMLVVDCDPLGAVDLSRSSGEPHLTLVLQGRHRGRHPRIIRRSRVPAMSFREEDL